MYKTKCDTQYIVILYTTLSEVASVGRGEEGWFQTLLQTLAECPACTM